MPRPKAGTKEGDRAIKRWKKTMLKKFGSKQALQEHMRERGRKGGSVSCAKGFASDKVGIDGLTGKQRASIAGYKGGRISRRTKKENR